MKTNKKNSKAFKDLRFFFAPNSKRSAIPGSGSRAWRAYLVVGVLTSLVYLLLPYSAAKALVLYPALGLSAVVVIVIGTRAHRPAHPLVWHLIAAGVLISVVGDTIHSFYEHVLGVDPFPSLADAFYLGSYLLIIASLLVLVRGRTPEGDWASFIDATIVATGLGMLLWVLMAPYVRDPSLSLLERSVLIAYPLADVLLLMALARFMFVPSTRAPVHYLLSLSLIMALFSDASLGVMKLVGIYERPGLIDAGFLLCYVLCGTAALHSRMDALTRPAPEPEVKPSRKRFVLLAGASLIAPAVLAIQAMRGDQVDIPAIVVGSAVLFSLVLVRMEGLLRTLATALAKHKQAEAEIRQLNENLERHVAERTAQLESTVADLKRAKESLKEYATRLQHSNRELQDFVRVASHDLQEPLRKVSTFSNRLKAKHAGALDEQGRDYLERMENAAVRMQKLIDDLLALSRVTTQAQPFEPVDLGEVAEEVVSDLEARIEQVGGRVEVGELPTIEADRVQMRQLLQNLIGNALKFHKAGEAPVVRVRGGPLEEWKKWDGGAADGRMCRIEVEDNGIGFDEKHLDRIFVPFQRLHGRNTYEGTGMGLSICRKVVERHDGQITAKSLPGQGTTFIVTLPIKQTRRDSEQL